MRAEEFKAGGWRSIEERDLPPIGEIVEFAQEERIYPTRPWFGRWRDLRPEFNVAGLWWREP